MAQRPSTQQMCFLPKGCWRFPNLLPTKKKNRRKEKNMCVIAVFVFTLEKIKFPPLEGRECVQAL